jgi:hypothetical protein
MVFAQGYSGIFQLAESSLLLEVRLKDKPPDIDTYQDLLMQYGLISQA